ncbi:metal ABC transporter solute-binding protein, Zn/Mn family [Haloimpatiens sp. FM7315]|uniref:metal ABC transporter solute-binding protein, Zn/Mn family n=1 Tax=Haloimpatiens sp. FM7315 TaxID=3298609 RepID=UPI00370B4B7E
MKNKLIIFSFISIFVLVGCGCGCNSIFNNNTNKSDNSKIEDTKNKREETKSVKLDILVSDKFLYQCVKNIDGGKHNVDYIFRTQQGENIIKQYYDIDYSPDLYIYDEFNYKGLNNRYIDKIQENKVGLINASRGINQLTYYKNVVTLGKKNECLFWNNIDNYKIVLVNIKNAIVERDPKNRNYYEKNFNTILKNLEKDEDFFSEKSKKIDDTLCILEGSNLNYIMAYAGIETISVFQDEKKELDPSKDKGSKSMENEQLRKVLNEKYKDKEKIVLIYYSDDFLKNNEKIISQFNIKCIKVNKINMDIQYSQLIKYEKNIFDTILNFFTNDNIEV